MKFEEWGLDDEIRKACLDLKIQGGFALEIVYNLGRTSIKKVKHCPFERIRSGEVNHDEKVEFYYYWRTGATSNCEPVKVRCFNPEDKKEYPHQILYVKPFSPGSYYYPKPDYVGSINYIELDKEIGTYHINNIKNGLAPSFTIHFKNGVPSQEERHRIRTDIERQLGGATNAGKFIVTYSDQPDRKPDFEPFPLSDADKQYQFLSTEVSDKIMVGHRVVSSAMFGVKTAGQLGNTQEPKSRPSCSTSKWSNLTSASSPRPSRASWRRPTPRPTSPSRWCSDEEIVEEQDNTELSADVLNLACDYFIEMGEEENDDEWELIDARRVDYDSEAQQDAMWTFATRPKRKAASKSRSKTTRSSRSATHICPRKRAPHPMKAATFVSAWSTPATGVAQGGHRRRFQSAPSTPDGVQMAPTPTTSSLQGWGSLPALLGAPHLPPSKTTRRSASIAPAPSFARQGLPPMEQNDRARCAAPTRHGESWVPQPKTGKHRNKWHSPQKSSLSTLTT